MAWIPRPAVGLAAVRAPDDVWVVTDDHLLRTIPPDQILEWTGAACVVPVGDADPVPRDGCHVAPVFVRLVNDSAANIAAAIAAVSSSTVLALATPALPGLELEPWQVAFIETEELGRTYVGALTGSAAAALELLEILRRRAPAVRPLAVCANPLPTRVLRPE